MTRIRLHMLAHGWLAMLLVTVALALRIALPAGTMLGVDLGTVRVQLCSGFGDKAAEISADRLLAARLPAHDGPGMPAKAQPCDFTALDTQALGAADALLLALAIALVFAAALALRPAMPAAAPLRLRPPSCGPPAKA